MKWKTSKLSPAEHPSDPAWEVVVADSLRTNAPVRGEPFDLTVLRSLTDGGAPQSPGKAAASAPASAHLSCEVIGDGKSLKIGNQIVRLVRRPLAGKKGSLRFRVGLGGLVRDKTRLVTPVRPVEPKKSAAALSSGDVKAPMTGKVISVRVAQGDAVKDDDVLVIIEAMKMENQIRSECSGTVTELKVSAGHAVSIDELLLRIKVSEGN